MTDDEAYERGRIVWHCSEEDGGPDVGMSLGLGHGWAMWVGEITRAAHADGGEAVAALGDDCGWWLMIYPDHVPLARFADVEGAHEFFDYIAGALSQGPHEGELRGVEEG